MTELSRAVDQDTFREGMSYVPTVVTVVTIDSGDAPCGVTIGSFASLSLDPPLVSYNLKKSAAIHGPATQAEHFVVHVLHEDQALVSNLFAIPDLNREEQLSEIETGEGPYGIPVLTDFLVRFVCKRHDVLDAGDHHIIVGLVEQIEFGDASAPLVYHRRDYHTVGSLYEG